MVVGGVCTLNSFSSQTQFGRFDFEYFDRDQDVECEGNTGQFALAHAVAAGGQGGFAAPGDAVEAAEAGRPMHSQILFLLEH